ncbi:MAG: hypothetical protein HC869_15545 [Rhodospirillales bacterium]|nr:hypothetical protein [Rhodospirillales bacterium]
MFILVVPTIKLCALERCSGRLVAFNLQRVILLAATRNEVRTASEFRHPTLTDGRTGNNVDQRPAVPNRAGGQALVDLAGTLGVWLWIGGPEMAIHVMSL